MAAHIEGPLHVERMGSDGPVVLFIHPNPWDGAAWLYQLAHLSTWFRCLAVDLPGYGRSPRATVDLTVDDLAGACWEAVDGAVGPERVVVVGSSVGSVIAQVMHRQQPDRIDALVLTGAAYSPDKAFVAKRVAGFGEHGIGYRRTFALETLAPTFRETPLAGYLVERVLERDATLDIGSIVHQLHALADPEPDEHHADLRCPVLILSGSEDGAHPRAFALRDRIPGAELEVIEGAGHACFLEQPWAFDRRLLAFLDRLELRV